MDNKITKELKYNTELLEKNFEKFNLKVLQFAFRQLAEDDYDAELIIELQAVTGEKISENAYIKANIYDEDNKIFFTQGIFISRTQFFEYDTYHISLFDDEQLLKRAKSAKIFIVKAS